MMAAVTWLTEYFICFICKHEKIYQQSNIFQGTLNWIANLNLALAFRGPLLYIIGILHENILHIDAKNYLNEKICLCYAMLCYAILCYAMLCYAMLCYAMLCYAMLCYAMLRYVTLYRFLHFITTGAKTELFIMQNIAPHNN